ncbi:lysophospholipase L1-like esterase [Rhizobium sp. BK650]|uniref:SGNH/GDSL hydrolase family protein n=1 Tax=Rhizobium sp. BK650 TaxID=2586990 RepID=UPI00160C1351|nr:GDSL-type esterase/lipase family protein [Rhizobium sp. BK650]MBB3656541.1 lysophospholipase L1-like esterase [Rhizobium sp. BK650]
MTDFVMRWLPCAIAGLLLLAAPQANAAPACDPVQALVAQTPVIEQSPVRLMKARQQQKISGALDVAIFGDSLAENWGPDLNRDFGAATIGNFGIFGDHIQELLWRLKEMPPAIQPKNIVLIIGTNNLWDGSFAPCGVSQGIAAVVDQLRSRWSDSKIYVVPILPRGSGFTFRAKDRLEANAGIERELAGKSGVTLVKIDENALTCGFAKQGCSNYVVDKLHLAPGGYSILRSSLAEAGLR